MTGWEIFAVATGPAVVTGIAAYAGVHSTSQTARAAIAADLQKARLERVHDRLQEAYLNLVTAERELSYQSPAFEPEDFQRWNDQAFRPAVSAVYILGSDEVRTCIDDLMKIYNAAVSASDHPGELAARLQETRDERSDLREKMIEEMKLHLKRELGQLVPATWKSGSP